MPSYALVSPQNVIDRIEPDTRIDPTVETKAGWRWLTVVEQDQPQLSALQRAERNDTVSGDQVVRGWSVTSRAPTSNDVNAERQRRLATFAFAGKVYDFGGDSTVNISGAGTLALAAIINGAQPGNLRWANPDRDFTWICADNSTVTMDAQTCFAFAQAAAQWKSGHINAARTIKDTSPIPTDYAANARWPS